MTTIIMSITYLLFILAISSVSNETEDFKQFLKHAKIWITIFFLMFLIVTHF